MHKIVRESKKSSASAIEIRSSVKRVSMYFTRIKHWIWLWQRSSLIIRWFDSCSAVVDIQFAAWEYLKNGEEWSAHSRRTQVKNEANYKIQ